MDWLNQPDVTHEILQDFTNTTRLEYRRGDLKPSPTYGLLDLTDIDVTQEVPHTLRRICATGYPTNTTHILRGKTMCSGSFSNLRNLHAVPEMPDDLDRGRYSSMFEHVLEDPFAIVAGGFVLHMVTRDSFLGRWWPSDMDIFSIGTEGNLERAITLARAVFGSRIVRVSRHAITEVHSPEMYRRQVIIPGCRSPSELLYSFDIALNQICIWRGRIYCTYEFVWECYHQCIVVDPSRHSINYLQRLDKYNRRGFAIHIPRTRAYLHPFTPSITSILEIPRVTPTTISNPNLYYGNRLSEDHLRMDPGHGHGVPLLFLLNYTTIAEKLQGRDQKGHMASIYCSIDDMATMRALRLNFEQTGPGINDIVMRALVHSSRDLDLSVGQPYASVVEMCRASHLAAPTYGIRQAQYIYCVSDLCTTLRLVCGQFPSDICDIIWDYYWVMQVIQCVYW